MSSARPRVCGAVGYRCPAEPGAMYVRKGRAAEQTDGRQCLCNGLLSAVGFGQRRPHGMVEPPIVTIGQDLGFLRHIAPQERPYGAESVVRWLSAGLTEAPV
ncbi:hypothetical protein [Streptomyces sp. NPDC054794]